MGLPPDIKPGAGGETLLCLRGGEGDFGSPVGGVAETGVLEVEDPLLQVDAESDLVGPGAAALLYPDSPLYEPAEAEEGKLLLDTAEPNEVPPLITVVLPYVGVAGTLESGEVGGAIAIAAANSGLKRPTKAAAWGFRPVEGALGVNCPVTPADIGGAICSSERDAFRDASRPTARARN